MALPIYVEVENLAPTSPINGFALIDSAQCSKDHPDTWRHPDSEALRRIVPGCLVKVGVSHPDLYGERFWGRVDRRAGPNITIQIQQADMLHGKEHGIHDQDVLIVQEQHIFGIEDVDGATIWEA